MFDDYIGRSKDRNFALQLGDASTHNVMEHIQNLKQFEVIFFLQIQHHAHKH